MAHPRHTSRHSHTRLHETAWLALALLMLGSCTGGGRMQPSQQQSDHPAPSPQEQWELSDRRLMPGTYAPLVRLPFLFPQGEDAQQYLDSINHQAHVILFWASWCSDCRDETPALVALQREFPALPWFTVSLDNEAAKARQYLREHHLRGTHLFDGRDWRGAACEDYAVALHGIPYMVLVDREGKLRWSGQQTDSLRMAIMRQEGRAKPL